MTKKIVSKYVTTAEKYVADVRSGKIDACKWVRLACDRHGADKLRAKSKDCPFVFDAKKADRAAVVIEGLPHTKGNWAARGEAFKLEPWQCFMVVSIFGWVWRADGVVHGIPVRKDKRRFRRAMLMVPRKSGKSELAARIGNYMFAADGEYGADVVSGATSEDQAWCVFTPAHDQVAADPDFIEHFGVEVMKSQLLIPANGSKYHTIIGKPGDGAGVSCGIIDEYHEHDTDELYNAVVQGMAAREQPLALVITTAGHNLSGPCFKMKTDLEKVLEGTVSDEFVWFVNYTIDDGDDWTTDASLRKANPNYGVSVIPGSKEAERAVAMRDASKQGSYKTKQLNVWVGAKSAYFNMQYWRTKCFDSALTLDSMKGFPCCAGMDLASVNDIASVALVFKTAEDRFALFVWNYVPEARTVGEENAQYAGWVKDGTIIATDGQRVDYRRIEADILDLHARFQISELAYDPWHAEQLRQNLTDKGLNCVEVRPAVQNFSEPLKTLAAMIMSGELQHNCSSTDPTTWMFANVVAKVDNKDNVYPNKERPEAKIDAPVASIMALSRAVVNRTPAEPAFQLFFVGN